MFTVELLSSARLWVKGDFQCTVNSERSCTGAPRRLWFHNQTATTSYSSTVMSPNIFFFSAAFLSLTLFSTTTSESPHNRGGLTGFRGLYIEHYGAPDAPSRARSVRS